MPDIPGDRVGPRTPSGGRRRLFLIPILLAIPALACRLALPFGPDDGGARLTSPVPTAAHTNSEPSQQLSPSPTIEPSLPIRWTCFMCGGDTIWELSEQGANRIELPASLGQYYDYSAAGERILYASHFADRGSGPANIAVSDLWLLDLAGGQARPLVVADVVAEALWFPDGERLAYIEALPETYQLVLMDADGAKTVLAEDVAFTWSISPDGEWVAFSRESRYALDVEPGLYSVNVHSGEEHRLSTLDRAGSGSIDDRPHWSLDSEWVLFSVSAGGTSAMDLARADGTEQATLGFDDSLADQLWYGQPVSSALWLPGATSFLGQARVSGGNEMGGSDKLVLYDLNLDRTSIIRAREIGEANGLIGWDEPGRSAWIMPPEGDRPVLYRLP